MDLNELQISVTKLSIKEGDTLVFTCSRKMNAEQLMAIHKQLAPMIPHGVKAALLSGDMSLEVTPGNPGGGSKV